MDRFWHSKRCVQVQFENYEKSKATKSRLNTKRGIGELAFQAQTAPIPLLTPTFRGLIFFYNSLRFTCPHLFCAESTPHHRIGCPILLNRPSGKQEICCQPVVCRICSTIRKDKWKPLHLYTVNIKKSTIPSVWFSKWIRTHFTIPVFRPYFDELIYGLNIHFT